MSLVNREQENNLKKLSWKRKIIIYNDILEKPKANILLNHRDSIFDSLYLQKFVQSALTIKGKKENAENILHKTLKALKIAYKGFNSFSILFESTEKVKFSLEVRTRKLGSTTIGIPIYIIGSRRTKITFLKFREALIERKEFQVYLRLLKEIFSILRYSKESYLCQLEIKVWNQIYSNRAYLHYRWY